MKARIAAVVALFLTYAPSAIAQEQPPAAVPGPTDPAAVNPAPKAVPAPVQNEPKAAPVPVQTEPKADTLPIPVPVQNEPKAPVPAELPKFAVYINASSGAYIKPILQLSGGLEVGSQVNPVKTVTTNQTIGTRYTTFAVARLGLEGSAGGGVSFKAELQRDPGEYGTSVWEGPGSLSARELWAKYERYGASISTGVILDPASVDFFSMHVADTLLTDKYTKTPLLQSGYNRGQGILAQFRLHEYLPEVPITVGFSVTAANPLASTTSAPFGGNVGALGDLNRIPRGASTDGNPASPNTEMDLLTPSLMFNKKFSEAFALDVRTAVQIYQVYFDKSDMNNVKLRGYNYRGSLRLGFLDNIFSVFGNASFRENQMYQSNKGAGVFDYTKVSNDVYRASVVSVGADFNYKTLFGVGGSFTQTSNKLFDVTKAAQYVSVGASLHLTDMMSLGIRRSILITKTDGIKDDGTPDMASWFIGTRLVI